MINRFLEKLKTADTNEYRSLPFWSWNDKLDKNELKRQIAWMKEKGMGGFFMHARSGLATEYLSDEWFDCIKTCADEAEKLGMDAWAYDENGWPSGFAGGKLLKREEDRDCYINYTEGEYDKSATVSYLIDDDNLVRTDVEGKGLYLNIFIETAVSTTDILNPDVVKRFINLTHEEYKKRLGDDFNKKIKGFFTDEPQYQRWKTAYSRMLPEYFQKHYNTDIFDELGLLVVKKNGYKRFRYRYWKAMQTLMLESFAKQLYEWCQNNGVSLTGHYAQEDTLGLQMTSNAGVMPFYQYEHIPGIDWLGRETDNEIPLKQLSSACEQLGKKKVLTETFGCCGWDISPSELGRVLGYQLVNGINMFCQHLIPYAEHGNRKRDFPPHFSPINPWVEKGFNDFNTTFTRLGWLLGESTKKTNVAVLHPIRSAYFDFCRDEEDNLFGIEELENNFKNVCNLLSKHNVAYHFLDETLLAQYGFVNDNKIGCKYAEYEYLIIPPIITMDATTNELLQNYVKNGGKILAFGEKPSLLEGEPYNFTYLNSNCTFEEIVNCQPYKVANPNTDIISVLAKYEDMPFVFMQNTSSKNSYTQSFDFGEEYKSLIKINPLTFATEEHTLDIKLEPNEFALCLLSTKEVIPNTKNRDYVLRFEKSHVCFEENTLTLDMVRISKDGKSFSKPYYTNALFDKLVKEKYNGTLYLKYEFCVEEIPSRISLVAEECSIANARLNDQEIEFVSKGGWDNHFFEANVTPMIKKGKNEYSIEIFWNYDENAYLALFGENVTEGLKNCLLNKNEIEAVYVCGKFGVYSKSGFMCSDHIDFVQSKDFYIGKTPEIISEPVVEGFPFFKGTLSLSKTINILDTNVRFVLDGNFHVAKLKINGKETHNMLFEKIIDVSEYLFVGNNLVEADITISPFNTYGPHHRMSEKYAWVSPFEFELTDTWDDGESELYHAEYDFLKLYTEL